MRPVWKVLSAVAATTVLAVALFGALMSLSDPDPPPLDAGDALCEIAGAAWEVLLEARQLGDRVHSLRGRDDSDIPPEEVQYLESSINEQLEHLGELRLRAEEVSADQEPTIVFLRRGLEDWEDVAWDNRRAVQRRTWETFRELASEEAGPFNAILRRCGVLD